MGEILAEAGQLTGPVTETSGQIVFGLLAAPAKLRGQQPMRFVAPASQLTGLSDGDLVIVRFSRADCRTMAGPLPVTSISRA
jgi:hypothetical protein